MDLDNKDTSIQYKIECVFTIYSETDSPYHWEIYKKVGGQEWEYLACYRLQQEAEYVLSRLENQIDGIDLNSILQDTNFHKAKK